MKERPTALVSGASSGIGRATAELLSVNGYRVFGTSRNPKKLEGSSGFEIVELDVDSQESVRSCLKEVGSRTSGRLDALINNAGVGFFGAIEETDISEAKSVFETNFFGVVRLTKEAIPMMRSRGGGKIINISSLAIAIPYPFGAFYAASKHALEGYSEALRFELAPFNIAVALVGPGYTRTDISKNRKTVSKKLDIYSSTSQRISKMRVDGINNGSDPKLVAEIVLKILQSKSPDLHNFVLDGETRYPRLRGIKEQDSMEPQVRRFWQI